MRGDLGDRARLQHILDAISEIESYTHRVGFDDFVGNSMMRFASIKQLEIKSLVKLLISPPLFWN